MRKVLILFTLIVIYKIVLNFTRLKQLQRFEKEFILFLSDRPSKIDEHKMQTIELFKKANIPDSQMPVTQPIGFGKVASFNASVYHNFPMAKRTIAEPSLLMFKNAIGVYKSRIFEAVNPLYWIDLIVFLPRNLLQALQRSHSGDLSRRDRHQQFAASRHAAPGMGRRSFPLDQTLFDCQSQPLYPHKSVPTHSFRFYR